MVPHIDPQETGPSWAIRQKPRGVGRAASLDLKISSISSTITRKLAQRSRTPGDVVSSPYSYDPYPGLPLFTMSRREVVFLERKVFNVQLTVPILHYTEWTQYICLYICLQPPGLRLRHPLPSYMASNDSVYSPTSRARPIAFHRARHALHPHNLLDALLISSQELHAAFLHAFRITGKKDKKPSEHNSSSVRYCDSCGKDLPKIKPAQTQIPADMGARDSA
ncbi:hypothetical protein OF83DRAFT_1171394 [Amylostereum chailletii]|nr:hypothetical protein OF83DRAFT_1171394 [Amylostereum chailletii]